MRGRAIHQSMRLCGVAALALVGSCAGERLVAPAAPAGAADTAQPHVLEKERQIDSLGLAAKVLASGVFISGREPRQVIEEDLQSPFQIRHDWARTTVDVDREAGRVTLSSAGVGSRTAVFTGARAQGVVLLPLGESALRFTPREIPRNLPSADSAWPLGDRVDRSARPSGIDEAALQAALTDVFDEKSKAARVQRTRALLVVHRGQLVAERYAAGFQPDQPLVGWSMGKTVAAVLLGIVANWEPRLQLQAPAPIAPWQGKTDSRAAITLADVMEMSSGLSCPMPRAGTPEYAHTRNVHNSVYRGIVDAHAAMLSRPLQVTPGSRWAYCNADTFALMEIVRDRVRRSGLDFLAFPQSALFDRIGARSFVLETDLVGNFLITGYDYATARDWARFGEFLLRDGVAFDGTRLLPEGWVDFMRKPAPAAPAAPDAKYGGQVWLNAGGVFPAVPRDAYYARGLFEQIVLVIPSRSTVVVRLGNSPGPDVQSDFAPYFDRVVADILRALPP
jgi:CubicO group peptidase (beta-lactamase class C family)